jgi:hypothetical protein
VHKDIAVSGFGAAVISAANQKISADGSSVHLNVFQAGERTVFNFGMQKNGAQFDPSIGFTQITGVAKWNADFGQAWYLDSEFFRRMITWTENSYLVDNIGELFSSVNKLALRFDFQSDDQITFFGRKSFESIKIPFQVFRSSTISPGEYTGFDAGVVLATKPGRTLSATASMTGGEFFDGSRLETSLTAVWKLNSHITFSQSYLMSDVKLSNSSFRAMLIRSRINYSLNTKFSVDALSQYDNAAQQLAVNFRASYIINEGTQVFLVFNEIVEGPTVTTALNQGIPLSRAILLKMTCLLSF